MKLAPRAEEIMEDVAPMANVVPRPLLDTQSPSPRRAPSWWRPKSG